MSDARRGPPIPIPPYTGSRYDPKEAWLFAKGVYGPPDLRVICLGKWVPDRLGNPEKGSFLALEDTVERFINRGWIKREDAATRNLRGRVTK